MVFKNSPNGSMNQALEILNIPKRGKNGRKAAKKGKEKVSPLFSKKGLESDTHNHSSPERELLPPVQLPKVFLNYFNQ
jgi:hypothetical protein